MGGILDAKNIDILLKSHAFLAIMSVLFVIISMSSENMVVLDDPDIANEDDQVSMGLFSSQLARQAKTISILETAQAFVVMCLLLQIGLCILLIPTVSFPTVDKDKVAFVMVLVSWLFVTIGMSAANNVKVRETKRWHFGPAFGVLVLAWLGIILDAFICFACWQPYLFCLRPKPVSVVFDIPLQEAYARTGQLPLALSLIVAKLREVVVQGRAVKLFMTTVNEEEYGQLCRFLDEAGDHLTAESLMHYSPHTLAHFLVEYLNRLPDPLLTYTRHASLLRSMDNLAEVAPIWTLRPAALVNAVVAEGEKEETQEESSALLSKNSDEVKTLDDVTVHVAEDDMKINTASNVLKKEDDESKLHTSADWLSRPPTISSPSVNASVETEMSASELEDLDRLFYLQTLILSLPKAHCDAFREVFGLLSLCVRNGDSSTVNQLSILFAPIITKAAPSRPLPNKHGVIEIHAKNFSWELLNKNTTSRSRTEGTGAHIDTVCSQQVVGYLIKHYSAIMHQHPYRQLHERAHTFEALTQRNADLEAEALRREVAATRLRLRVAYIAGNKRIVLMCFHKWRAHVRSVKDITTRQYEQIASLQDRCQKQTAHIISLEKVLANHEHTIEMHDFSAGLVQDGIPVHITRDAHHKTEPLEMKFETKKRQTPAAVGLPTTVAETKEMIDALKKDLGHM